MSEHRIATLVRRGFERFVGGDPAGLLELLRVRSGLARAGHQCDERRLPRTRRDHHVPAAYRQSPPGGTYRVELLWVVADDDHAVAVYRAQGERDGERSLDIEQALLIRVEDGRWIDVRAQPLDQAAFDAFWA